MVVAFKARNLGRNAVDLAGNSANRLMLFVMLAGVFVVALDFFIVNVALPSIARELQASSGALQLVVAGYVLANCAMLITGGRLGDIHGPKKIFAVGLTVFVIASAACGLAPTATFLVFARIVQGAAGAMLLPQVLAMLNILFPREQRAKAFAAYGLALGMGAISGQLVGGLLLSWNPAGLGWRSCFLINLPIGIVTLLLSRGRLPIIDKLSKQTLDIPGAIILSSGLLALVTPLILGREQGWPQWSLWFLLTGIILFIAFFRHQYGLDNRGGQPLISPFLLSFKPFILGLFVILTFYCGNASFYYVLALYMQIALGVTPLHAGLYFTVMAGAFFLASIMSPSINKTIRIDLTIVGMLILATGHFLMFLSVATGRLPNISILLSIFTIQGTGIGFVLACLPAAVLQTVPITHAGVASSLVATAQQLGNALGVALIGIVFYSSESEVPLNKMATAFGQSELYLLVTACAIAILFVTSRKLLLDGKR